MLEKIYKTRINALIFLFVLSSVLFIGLGKVHLFDWDEINFAESAREMIASGNYLRVQIDFEPFWEKPPLFFWLQVIAMKLFGVNEFAARFPNAVFGFVYLVTLFLIGARHFNNKFGLMWSLVYIGSILPHFYFKSGIIDPIFNYFIFIAIYFMVRSIHDETHNKKWAVFSGIMSGLSVLTKGPVGFLLLALTLLVFVAVKGRKYFPSLLNILTFFAGFIGIVSIWVGAEVFSNGWSILWQFIDYQIGLLSSPVAGHKQPFYYHFVVVFIGCFPSSVFALPTFFNMRSKSPYELKVWMRSLFWVVMIVFTIVTTKIVHYSSMAYLPLSFLATFYLFNVSWGRQSNRKWLRVLFLIMGLLLGSLLMTVPLLMVNKEILYPLIKDPFALAALQLPVDWTGWEASIWLFFLIAVVFTYFLLKRNRQFRAVAVIGLASFISLELTLQFMVPKIEAHSQRSAIEFYEELSGKECYVTTLGFKSYAHYFYFQQPDDQNKQRKNKQWLLTGNIDKPAYFVSKITHKEAEQYDQLKKIGSKGGFDFYVREVGK
jgi:4-amino-4-deoxy-L-arabinose transferase-like glycosyltransferase